MEDLAIVEAYLRFGKYPDTYSKGHNNFKFSNGVLYYRRAVKTKESRLKEGNWRICVRTEEEQQRILESCHAGLEGNIVITLV